MKIVSVSSFFKLVVVFAGERVSCVSRGLAGFLFTSKHNDNA